MDIVQRICFWLGEHFFRLGLILQQRVDDYVLGVKSPSPQQILDTLLMRNQHFLVDRPLKTHRPVGIVVICSDHRIDWDVITGDARDCFDIVRIPGGIVTKSVVETIRIAVKEDEVKLVMLVTHSGCTMADFAKSETSRTEHFPILYRDSHEKDERYADLLGDCLIQQRILDGSLIIARTFLETDTRELSVQQVIDSQTLPEIAARL
ncbi:MAG: carbonic anhydrase [bacterium]|nr:carbonic anhydrase [bacterium]